MNIFKTECFLRVSATLVLVLVVFLVRFDSQTKVLIVEKKATYRDLNAFVVLVGVDAAAAGYSFLQLLLRIVIYFKRKANLLFQALAWICFVLDQVTVYVVFAATAAALTASVLSVTGASSFEWMELCSKYTNFCIQIGFAMFFGFVASFFLVAVSFLSAFNLFRLYSSRGFFRLESK